MKENRFNFAVEKMCKAFKVSRSGYHDWLHRRPSRRALEAEKIKKMIRSVHLESKGRYGSPKITKELRFKGVNVSRPRVARMMRSEGIRSIIQKRYRVTTTDSNHNYKVSDNHLKRNFKTQSPGQVWVSDITYIATDQGWLYLTIIMDLYDRKIIGWALSRTMATRDTIMAAWRMALINRPISRQLIFHSDRGVQYASNEFRQVLNRKPVTQSMSRKADCWNNAVAENFFKILKSELIYHSKFQTRLHAKNEVFEFIEIWYNRKRRHSYLGYLTPNEYGKYQLLNTA